MVATDGSELVKRAVNLAIEISKLSEAKLYAVYVIDLKNHNSINHPGAENKEATAYVEKIGRVANVEVESIILEGNPANEIIDFAETTTLTLLLLALKEKLESKVF